MIFLCLIFLLSACDASLFEHEFDGENYFSMPKINQLDDYDECMETYKDEAKYCFVKGIIKPPEYPSKIYDFIKEFSSNKKQHFRHDKLARGVCLNKCSKLISTLHNSINLYYQPIFDHNERTLTFDFVNFPHAQDDQANFNVIINQCVNFELKNSHNLTAYSSIEYCRGRQSLFEIDSLDVFFVVLTIALCIITDSSSFYDYRLRKKLLKSSTADALMRSTAEDHYKTSPPTLFQKFMVSFSLWRNWYLLSAPTNDSMRDLRAISTVRIWTMISIVFGHATWFIMGALIENPIFVEKNYHLLRGMIVINGGNLVQTFFFISGFLNSMSLLSYVDRTRRKNFMVFIKAVIYRIIRFVPVLLFLILLHSTWLQRLDDGPYWDKFNAYERQACRKNMWWNLLLINNYLSDEMRCMIHTWYIAADFQLSVIGTGILLLVVNNPMKKNLLLFGSIFISFLITFVHLYVNRLEPILMLPPETLRDQLIGGSDYDRYLYQYHTPTHLNTGNYLVGLVIGYFYYQYKQTNGKSTHEKTIFLNVLWNCSWIMTFILSLVGLYFYENDIELGVLSSLLGAFFKHFYGVILGVALVGIFLRYGFFIPNIFNYGMHRILARLSFSVYMVHISIGSLFIMKNKFLIEINNSMLTSFTGIIYMLSHGAALFLVLCIELPVNAIYKIIVDEITEKPKENRRIAEDEKDLNSNNVSSKL